MFICYYPVYFTHRIFEEYLYLTRAYRSLPKLPCYSNACSGLSPLYKRLHNGRSCVLVYALYVVCTVRDRIF